VHGKVSTKKNLSTQHKMAPTKNYIYISWCAN